MNNHTGAAGQAADAFTKFWTDAMGRMASSAGSMFGASQEEMGRQMRQAFFESWERHCEEFMKSQSFLDSMKKSLDQAVAFREQMNQFLTKSLNVYQMPSQEDTDSILLAVRRLEDRVLKRVDDLSRRVEAMETRAGAGTGAGVDAKPRTAKGGAR